MSEKEELEKRKKELDTRAIKLAEEKEALRTEKEYIEKRTEKTREGEKKLAEKKTELEKKKAVLDVKEEYLEAAKVVKEVTGKVELIGSLVAIVLVLSAIAAAMGTGLWFFRIPNAENRITGEIAVLDQKIATLSVEKVSQYGFVAVSQKTGDRKNFGFDVEKMEGKVFTSGVSGGKNLCVESGDSVVVALTDIKSGVVLEKTFERVQPGDVIEFVVVVK